MLTLERIASRHKEWIKIAIYVGANPNNVADAVQDMYLKLAEIQEKEGNLERITNLSGDVNTVYIFKLLTNESIKTHKKDSKTIELPNDIDISDSNNNVPEEAYQELITIINQSINEMHSYEKMLMELHFDYGMSMRKIEQNTGIPTHSIFHTLKNAKQKIKSQASERYNEYRNERNDNQTNNGSGRCDSISNEETWD
jgi:RNA polymerase sigma factor (sigma-70 family)